MCGVWPNAVARGKSSVRSIMWAMMGYSREADSYHMDYPWRRFADSPSPVSDRGVWGDDGDGVTLGI